MTTPKKKAAKKRPVKKAGPKAGTDLIAQPHGGRIYQGAPANPVAGTGRPPAEVKARALKAFDDAALPELERLTTEAVKDSDRIAAASVLAKAGLSDGISRSDVRKALSATLTAIRDALAPEVADSLLAAIKPHWSAL